MKSSENLQYIIFILTFVFFACLCLVFNREEEFHFTIKDTVPIKKNKQWQLYLSKILGTRHFCHSSLIVGLAFHPDGEKLISAGCDAVKVWDIKSKKEVISIVPNSDYSILCMALSPDGAKVAVGIGNSIKVWDISTGIEVLNILGHSDFVEAIAFSPDGNKIVSGSNDHTIKLWNASSGSLLFSGKEHTEIITAIAFSPDGNKIVSGSRDCSVKIWDAHTLSSLSSFHTKKKVLSLAFFPNGKQLMVGTMGRPIEIWDLKTLKTVDSYVNGSFNVENLVFSPDGLQVLLASTVKKEVTLWDVQNNYRLRSFRLPDSYENAVAFSPDGSLIATGTNFAIRLWNTFTGNEIPIPNVGHQNAVYRVSFLPDSKQLISADAMGIFKVWNINTGEEKRISFLRSQHCSEVNNLIVSSNGTVLAATGVVDFPLIWDMQTGKLIRRVSAPHFMGKILDNSLFFSPDGQYIIGSSIFGIEIVSISSGKRVKALDLPGIISAIALSPNMKVAIAQKENHKVNLGIWDIEKETTCFWSIISEKIKSLTFSPDSKTVASRDCNGKIKLWNLGTNLKMLHELPETGRGVAMTFSPDGYVLASVNLDKKAIDLWDVKTGKQIQQVCLNDGVPLHLQFSPDSNWLAVGNQNFTINLFSVQ